ncbi:MAG: Asp23/Gls24 family envelope stress response protein [Erysipelotrichaceae bacterium]|nr:Asp23/Gls24 family envelope stress response protein [Erysipelotrichaceae bacterium]
MIEKTTDYGQINLSTDVIATICGGAATECYGVVGMASQKMIDGFYDLLKRDNYSKGIVVENGETGTIINLYIVIGYGVKISEIVYEVQKKVKYVVESTLDINVEAINVYVQSIKIMD